MSVATVPPAASAARQPAARSASSGCTRASRGRPTTSWSDSPNWRAAAGDCQRTTRSGPSTTVTSVEPATSERKCASRVASRPAYRRTSSAARVSRRATTPTPTRDSVIATGSRPWCWTRWYPAVTSAATSGSANSGYRAKLPSLSAAARGGRFARTVRAPYQVSAALPTRARPAGTVAYPPAW